MKRREFIELGIAGGIVAVASGWGLVRARPRPKRYRDICGHQVELKDDEPDYGSAACGMGALPDRSHQFMGALLRHRGDRGA